MKLYIIRGGLLNKGEYRLLTPQLSCIQTCYTLYVHMTLLFDQTVIFETKCFKCYCEEAVELLFTLDFKD